MGRLIDADELLKAMDTWDKFGYSTRYELERLDKDDKGFVPYVHYDDMLKAVNGMPTIEAIPKADYEARLKTDMAAMLEELKKCIEDKVYNISAYSECLDCDVVDYEDANEIIIEKINALKENTDGENT